MARTRQPLDFEAGFVRVLGHRLFWTAVGTPAKGTILGLHGGGGDHRVMRAVADLATLGYRVVLYDQLGCGRSEHPRSARDLTVAHLAEEVEAVRRRLRLGRCHLVGYSWGAALALETIVRHPRSYRTLTVSSGWANTAELESEVRRLVRAMPPRMRAAIERVEFEGKAPDARYPEADAEFRRRHLTQRKVPPLDLMAGLTNPHNARMWKTVDRSLKEWDVRDRLGRIRVPTLITVGRRDHVTPRCSRTIQRGIRGSRLVIFERSGHGALFDERDHYLDVVRSFLDAHRSSR